MEDYMYKILVTNFYNTLINKEEAISLSTMLEIDKMRNNNYLFVVATSGLFRTILDYNNSYVFSDYIISYNGAHIYDTVKEKTIFKKCMNLTSVNKISQLDVSNISFYTLNSIFYTNKVLDSNYGVKIGDLDDFIEFHKKDIYEIRLYDTKDNLINISKILDNMDVNYYIRNSKNKYYIEVINKDINKFNASKIILKKEKIDVSDMVSIGCSSNDYELVNNAGFGVCIKNGDDDIKSIANYVTKRNNTLGVKEIIDKYFKG